MMDRRRFLATSLAAAAAGAFDFAGASLARAAPPARYRHLLVLVELKGGNDGLNTLVPFADAEYYALRPKLAIARDAVVQLSDRAGLHPALALLKPLWDAREIALLQGVGYPDPNLSHFRSIEIWDTASASDEYLQEGWLARTFETSPAPASFAADGVIIGSQDLGPLAGGRTRTVALANPESFVRQSRLATAEGHAQNRALAHILKVEGDVLQAAAGLGAASTLATTFPTTPFGNAIRAACQVIANPAGVAVVRVSLGGFDTHSGQAATQARLLGELADGLIALNAALVELDRWNDTLVLTYAEFGRRPKENLSNGTDHGTSNVHFALGGRVAGGFYGEAPALARLGSDGNPSFAVDFRSVYATVLDKWWGVRADDVLRGRYAPLPFVRS
jgi:uncharacterized protein (DUF1501 family)